MNWQKRLKGKVKLNEPLKKHTAYRIGGPAKIFFEPKDAADLRTAITLFKKSKIPVFVIGAGSNILAADTGLKAAVISLNSPDFRKTIVRDKYIEAGAGVPLGEIAALARGHALSGAEFLTGIPGTVGGALVMNAGAWGKAIGDLVEKISLLDYNGRQRSLGKADLNFAYRKSGLGKYIILAAQFKLVKAERKIIAQRMKSYAQQRRRSQDFSRPCCGCVFKNPAQNPAGKLLEACRLKGKRIGGAMVSLRHANFILNQDNARAADVLKLIALSKKTVKKRFNVSLEPEVRIWK